MLEFTGGGGDATTTGGSPPTTGAGDGGGGDAAAGVGPAPACAVLPAGFALHREVPTHTAKFPEPGAPAVAGGVERAVLLTMLQKAAPGTALKVRRAQPARCEAQLETGVADPDGGHCASQEVQP